MSDLPAQGLFQQLNAKNVSGEHLEVLGKRASALWSSGECETLNDAVVETVKHAGLSPEQVKRVIEFTNTDAYLKEFKKEGSHRVVNFGSGGPASPSEILKDLNDGGGGSVFDRGTGDYHQPPRVKTASARALEKTASVAESEPDAVDDFFQKLSSGATDYPEVNPYGEVLALRDKLASDYDNMTSTLTGLESAYADLADRIYSGVKQAALSGRTLGEVVQVWGTAHPSQDHIKIAFELVAPRLIEEGVFHTADQLTSSIEKVGGVRMVNPKHLMVTDFQEYCEVLSKLAELRFEREEVRDNLGQLNVFIQKEAGLVPKVVGAAAKASVPAGKAGKRVAESLLGKGHEGAEAVGKGVELATKYSPHAAALVGANEARRHLKYSPTWNKFQALANPHSDQYQQREYEIAQRGGYGQ